ncbi:MAG TPA: diaminopimelate epimerase [Ferruginibacter sp.]|jgi:diaminopimelate epimerase|nr:diaminopimelate epimerase [Ferruginibacter sp.]MBN8700087.1 diaminopimelate epimerase [Chitinophagales bacterium]HNA00431.1 diaminopimelate epimerase [Ferruginibacter sp.]HNJ94819.1 diaminopimelate epimerase [Ferruginibacter sp.]HNL64714.1 diaminopimelate epimerase [Ferruginibacter sp.]
MKIEFYKYQGTGNDFVILDNRDERYSHITGGEVKLLCDRRFGIGADGLMMLNNKKYFDFEMIYFNADGNPSTMCGNGGRCLVKFAHLMGIHKNTYHFVAVDGKHEAEIDMQGKVRLKMQDVYTVNYHNSHIILNTGSPHFIKFAHDVENIDVFETGREIRYSKEFRDEGINVNFVETVDEDGIFVRTYERGVENETYSCGTGVTAAALMSAHNDKGFNRVEVRTPGGRLSVEFDKFDDQHFENIWLCGPAELVFKGEIEI